MSPGCFSKACTMEEDVSVILSKSTQESSVITDVQAGV